MANIIFKTTIKKRQIWSTQCGSMLFHCCCCHCYNFWLFVYFRFVYRFSEWPSPIWLFYCVFLIYKFKSSIMVLKMFMIKNRRKRLRSQAVSCTCRQLCSFEEWWAPWGIRLNQMDSVRRDIFTRKHRFRWKTLIITATVRRFVATNCCVIVLLVLGCKQKWFCRVEHL